MQVEIKMEDLLWHTSLFVSEFLLASGLPPYCHMEGDRASETMRKDIAHLGDEYVELALACSWEDRMHEALDCLYMQHSIDLRNGVSTHSCKFSAAGHLVIELAKLRSPQLPSGLAVDCLREVHRCNMIKARARVMRDGELKKDGSCPSPDIKSVVARWRQVP